MKAFRKICLYLSTILSIVCFLFPQKGKAESPVTLTVELTADGAALSGAEFKLYRIGSHLNGDGDVTLDEPYASHFTVTLGNVTDWDELAKDIATFIDAEGLPLRTLASPMRTAKHSSRRRANSARGCISFPEPS